ncbi:MAG: amidase [Candidatus Dormiibacterota bacterium]
MGVARLAELLRRGQVSPAEVLTECLAAIDRLEPQLNAFVAVLREPALTQAGDSERRLTGGQPRPLEGVPVAIKDNRGVAGFPVTNGSASAPQTPAPRDSEVVARLRAAGAILIGKTALPEFAAIPVTESLLLGPTRNPWNLERTPGGSSGGSAAAVAAGMVPAAEGNDGGGSLRIPGSCCGLFALKPTRGRISLGPDGGDGLGGLVSEGFLTRSVADTALLLDVVSGAAPGDPYSLAPPRLSFVAATAAAPSRLRVAFTTLPPSDVPLHPACEEAVAAAARLLEGLGHQVEPVDPRWQREVTALDFRTLWASSMTLSLRQAELEGGDPRQIEPHVRALADLGSQLEAVEYLLARQRLHLFGASIGWLWERYDVLLTPTLAQPPLQVGELLAGTEVDPLAAMDRSDRFSPFSTLANVTGRPAAQLPLHQHQGLPIGVQLIGRYGDEATLLQLSQALEEASDWTNARPPTG